LATISNLEADCYTFAMKYLYLLLIMSCAHSNYLKNSPDCPSGQWKVFYYPNGEKITRKITPTEFQDNTIWVNRIDYYQAQSFIIKKDSSLNIGKKLIYQFPKIDYQNLKELNLLQAKDYFSIQIDHQVYTFNSRTKSLIKKESPISGTLKEEMIPFKKFLIMNPFKGERYRSEYVPLSYQCQKN